MIKARVTLFMDFNIQNRNNLSDELMLKIIHTELWNHIETLWKSGELDNSISTMNQFCLEVPIKIK